MSNSAYFNRRGCVFGFKTKTLRITRVLFFLFFICCMTASAKSISQTVTISGKDLPLKTIFSVIKKQTGYVVFGNSEMLSASKPVTLSVKDMPLEQFLKVIFRDQPFSYLIEGKTISIVKKQTEKAVNAGEQKPVALETSPPKKISGVVVGSNGTPLVSASVSVKNAQLGTTTDGTGNFSLEVPEGASVLVISYIGYETIEMPISKAGNMKVILKQANQQTQEVVVVGYGSQRKKMLTTAVSSVTAKQVNELPVTTPGAALAGQAPGVSVQLTNGSPGQPAVIRVRGMGSIQAGNAPLYVVDGYPLDNPDAFNMINAQDIESIQVLKDAAAAAIYGSRGGNGVVIVSTKRGQKGPAKFAVTSYVGSQKLVKKVAVLNTPQFLDYEKDYYINKGLAVPDVIANPPANLPNTDWQDEIYRQAAQSNLQLSINGGSDAVKYSLTGGYLSQDGIVDLTKYRRFSMRFTMDAQVSKKLKVGTSVAPSYAITDNKSTQGIINGGTPEAGGGIAAGGVINTGVAMPSLYPVKYANGDYAQPAIDPLYNSSLGTISPNLTNPVASLHLYEDRAETPLFLGSAYLEYNIIGALKFKSTFGFQYGSSSRNVYTPSTLGRPGFVTASISNPNLAAIGAQRVVGVNYNWVSENYFSYDKSFGDHTISAVAGYSAQQNKATLETENGQAGTFFNNDIHNVANAGQIFATTGYNENTLVSLYGRVNYSYQDKYLLSAAIRQDGSSRFGTNNKYAVFPAVSAAWRIGQEKFMKELDAVSELKIRASYGLTGNNNIGNYTWQSYQTQNNYAFGEGNGNRVFGYMPGGISNPDLTWETNRQTDLGLELGLFKDRIYFVAEAYKRTTDNLLLARNIPAIVGFATSVTENVGKIENKGLELSLTSKNMVGAFKWSTNANISFNKNKVINLVNANFIAFSPGGLANSVRLAPGQPLGAFYGYQQIGVYKDQKDIDNSPVWAAGGIKPGDIKYADINKDGKVDANDITYLGNPQPKFIYGLTNSFEYKNFDLNILIRGSQGNMIMNANDRLPFYFNGAVNPRTNVLDRWRSDAQPGNGWEPRVGGVAQNVFSTRFLHDASFLQITNITLGYNLPQQIVSKAHIDGLRFYAAVQNLYTFTKYTGYNPEASIFNDGGSTQMAVDQGSYPVPRTILLGLNIHF